MGNTIEKSCSGCPECVECHRCLQTPITHPYINMDYMSLAPESIFSNINLSKSA